MKVRGVPTRVLYAGLLLAALLLAGVVSSFASSDPDGLNRVAEDEGFASTEGEHAAADGPLAGYETRGVEDDRVSGGLAGIVGSGVVLLVMGGIVYAVRARGGRDSRDEREARSGPVEVG